MTSVPLLLILMQGAAALDAPATVRVRARAVQPGEAVVLTIVTLTPSARVSVRAFDRDAPAARVDDRNWRAIVGIDLDTAPGRYEVSIVIDPAKEGPPRQVTQQLTVAPKTFPRRTLTVDDAFVNPPAAVLARIQTEAQILTALWNRMSPEPLWRGSFIAPVPQASNSAFGTRSVYNGQARSPHSGADFRSPAGTPVRAPNAGRVVLARDLYYSGRTVVIDHGLGLFSLFAHLSAIDVSENATIRTGDRLGLVGATGRVTGPHLHWAVRIGTARVDPLSVLVVLGPEGAGGTSFAVEEGGPDAAGVASVRSLHTAALARRSTGRNARTSIGREHPPRSPSGAASVAARRFPRTHRPDADAGRRP